MYILIWFDFVYQMIQFRHMIAGIVTNVSGIKCYFINASCPSKNIAAETFSAVAVVLDDHFIHKTYFLWPLPFRL